MTTELCIGVQSLQRCAYYQTLTFQTWSYLYVEVLDTPLKSFMVRVEEYIHPVSANSAASVENLYWFAVIIALDNHFCAEWVSFVSGYEKIALGYSVPTCCYTIRIFATAFRTRAVCGYPHLYGLPFTGVV